MLHSSVVARTVSVLVGLLVTPLALILLSIGGTGWLRYIGIGGFLRPIPLSDAFGMLAVPSLLMLVGVVLLLLVVATGYWSSLGLLATAVVGFVPTVVAIFPGLYMGAMPVLRELPFEWTEGLARGASAPILWTLFAMGLVLLWMRKRGAVPSGGIGLAIAGALLAPLLLLGSALLFIDGAGRGFTTAIIRLDPTPDPLAAFEVCIGALLLVVAVLCTRWSNYALVVPALFLALFTLLWTIPPIAEIMYRLAPVAFLQNMLTPLFMGTAGAIAAIMLGFTAVLMAVRRRMLRQQAVAAPSVF